MTGEGVAAAQRHKTAPIVNVARIIATALMSFSHCYLEFERITIKCVHDETKSVWRPSCDDMPFLELAFTDSLSSILDILRGSYR